MFPVWKWVFVSVCLILFIRISRFFIQSYHSQQSHNRKKRSFCPPRYSWLPTSLHDNSVNNLNILFSQSTSCVSKHMFYTKYKTSFIVLNIYDTETPKGDLKPTFVQFRGIEISEVRCTSQLTNSSSEIQSLVRYMILCRSISDIPVNCFVFSWRFINEFKEKRSCSRCC